MMIKKLYIVVILCMANMLVVNATEEITSPKATTQSIQFLPPDVEQRANLIYDSVKLGEAGLEREIFHKLYRGYLYLLYRGKVKRTNVITVADFSQSSRNKRLYVIDIVRYKLVFNTYVSHGKNSGEEMATSFSNIKDSFKSTLGFMLTNDTYVGSAGYSLRFAGMEPGINDRVRFRDIIVHGSHYVNARQASEDGRVGNSLGCPAVPMSIARNVIDYIKGGSVYFIYHPDELYQANSPVLNGKINRALKPLMPEIQLAPAATGTPQQ
jgi:hypothetical protein